MIQPASLTGPERPPLRGGAARHLVVLLHGLGADGNDLIGLADAWAGLVPDAAFLAPDAPEPCDLAPMGRQWFSLQSRTPVTLLAGARRAAPVLEAYLDRQCARFGVAARRLALVGFSQGTMMALHVALRRAQPVACVLGYSGALVGAESLPGEVRSRPPVLLVHGDADQVVPIGALHGALDALTRAEVAAEWHICRGTGHGIDPQGLALGGRFLAERLA